MRGPNVILSTTDQQRFDTLGVNGNTQIRTPHLDALARGGVNFTNAFVQNTVCVPSRACLQTGRYTHQHGVTYMEEVIDETPGLPSSEKTFMEILQGAGYRTAAVGKIHMYPEKGFHQSVLTGGKGARWTRSKGQTIGLAPLGPAYAAWLEEKRPGGYEEIYAARRSQKEYSETGVFENPLSADEYVETWIGERAAQVVEERSGHDEPFFLWCGFCGPHDPWDPPEPYRSMYAPEDMPLPEEFPGWPSWRSRWSECQIRKMRSYYWGMVSCIDDQIGRLVRLLREKGAYDETLIVVTSDHGEFMGERARTGKALFFDSILHVPFIVKPPRSSHYKACEIDHITENFNLAPTILDYAGITVPPTMAAHSIRPLIERGMDGREAAFSEFVSGDKKAHGKCVRTASHKYVHWLPDGKEELYDLKRDPREKENLAMSLAHTSVKAEMKGRMLKWLMRTEWRHNYP